MIINETRDNEAQVPIVLEPPSSMGYRRFKDEPESSRFGLELYPPSINTVGNSMQILLSRHEVLQLIQGLSQMLLNAE